MLTVPEFPLFRQAKLSDRDEYNRHFAQFEPYSDFSFNNLWVWFNGNNGLAFSRHGDNLIIRFDNPLNGSGQDYTILGTNHYRVSAQRLLRWQRAMGIPQRIVNVTETALKSMPKRALPFKISEDRDNFDYTYELDKLVEAKGGSYASYRYSISSFKRKYPNHEGRLLDLADTKQCVALINRLHVWDTVYRKNRNQALLEGKIIDRNLRYAAQLGTKCLGMFIDGNLQAFLLYHTPPQKGWAIANHLKCNNEFSLIFDATFGVLFSMLYQDGFTHINLEQDLGIPGIRAHKQSLRPCGYLKRYTITP